MTHVIDLSINIDDFLFPDDPNCKLEGPFNRVPGNNPEFVYDLKISTQSGTHIQGPHYFLKDGKRLDAFPLESFMGETIIIDLIKRGEDTTKEDMINLISPTEGKGKILILRTGHMEELVQSKVLDPTKRPGLSLDCAKYLAEDVGVRMLGIDSIGFESRVTDNYEVNVFFCQKEIILLECLTNLKAIKRRDFWLSAVPIRIDGTEGAPCRAYAIEKS